ncbi:MAG: hypothetical protein JW734_09920 [Candidatus Omnitrophica bacterium]|nr:hypothetical protein [Candidatus Omnitrophota bacterium]
MTKSKKTLQANLQKLWKASKKEFDHLTKETSKLLKKGEKHLQEVTHKSQEKMELINATLRREKLYYELGKAVGSLPKVKWSANKKASSTANEISKLNKKIKSLSN